MQKSQTILKKDNKAEESHLPDYNIYRATVINPMWYAKKIDTDEWNRREFRNNPQICGKLIFNKWAMIIQHRRDSLFKKQCWENWIRGKAGSSKAREGVQRKSEINTV